MKYPSFPAYVRLISVLVISLLSTQVNGDGVTRGAVLANSCAACHGTDGRGSGRIPRINDFSKGDLVEVMRELRKGGESVTIMDRHAKGYTDEEVAMIADHYAGLKKK